MRDPGCVCTADIPQIQNLRSSRVCGLVPVFVSWGCHKVPQTGGLKQQKFILSEFWRLRGDQGVGKVVSFGGLGGRGWFQASLLGSQMASPWVFTSCMPKFPLLTGTPGKLDSGPSQAPHVKLCLLMTLSDYATFWGTVSQVFHVSLWR